MIKVSNFPNAYKEVYIILKYVDENDLKLIPKEVINTIETRMNKEHEFEYDVEHGFEEQKILRETKAILSYIFLNYWANEKQKKVIEAQFKKDLEKAEQEKKEIYNTDNIFKNKKEKNTAIQNEQNIQERAMIEYKDNLFTRIKNWFKSLFGKK